MKSRIFPLCPLRIEGMPYSEGDPEDSATELNEKALEEMLVKLKQPGMTIRPTHVVIKRGKK
jgi:hypothetical protein